MAMPLASKKAVGFTSSSTAAQQCHALVDKGLQRYFDFFQHNMLYQSSVIFIDTTESPN